MARLDNDGYGTWSETGVGTNAGVSTTHAAVAGKVHIALAIQASGDAAGLVTVESPAATILYKKRYAAAFNMSENFVGLKGTRGSAILVKVSASTTNSEANIQGTTVN